MENEGNGREPLPVYNYTVYNGNTVPDKTLGPLFDHTTNSANGSFLYWDYRIPLQPQGLGRMNTLPVEVDVRSCLRFSYYLKSRNLPGTNGTKLNINVGGCMATTLWSFIGDDSNGWQTATVPFKPYACSETFSFDIIQNNVVPIAYAIDDVMIGECQTLPTSTTTSTSTTTVTTTTTTRTTTTTTSTTTTTVTSTATSTASLSTTTTADFTTTTSLTSSITATSQEFSSMTTKYNNSALHKVAKLVNIMGFVCLYFTFLSKCSLHLL
ncbi:unnamed protein product [Didymodactylos carnosus]|uniref:MAM domain-containing protein n=1 Tax=Didymodactylos carnosus TaxID=1234261 RepID=A0A816BPB9_9BILA|nr:unnamed protein product [Didymodactylos carnosus]CAF4498154.1 unnamed protein product [Didymodactylos carnosus]